LQPNVGEGTYIEKGRYTDKDLSIPILLAALVAIALFLALAYIATMYLKKKDVISEQKYVSK